MHEMPAPNPMFTPSGALQSQPFYGMPVAGAPYMPIQGVPGYQPGCK